MKIDGYIKLAKMEIGELEIDLLNVENETTFRIIKDAIQNRKDTIETVKEKYGEDYE